MPRVADPTVRAALIEAAAERLATEGLDALSLRKVAADVGTSTQAVYTHFGSKEDLVRAVVEEAFDRLHTEIAGVPETRDPIEDLAGVSLAYRRNALANAHLYRVMFGLNPLALTDPAAHLTDPDTDQLETGLEAFGAMVAQAARCVEAGLLHGDPVQVALCMWSTAHGVVSLELAGFLGSPAEAQATFERATRATFVGLMQE